MAYKRKRVGEVSTTTVLLLAAAGVGVVLLAMNMNKPAAPVTVIKPPAVSNNALTAAEITAGASVVNTLVNDLTPDEEES
jgi:hypothetical protein